MHLLPVNGDCYWRRRGNRENIRLVDWITNLTRRNIAVIHRSTADFELQLISTWYKCRYSCSCTCFAICASGKIYLFVFSSRLSLSFAFLMRLVHRIEYQRNEWICMLLRRHENLILSIRRNTYLHYVHMQQARFRLVVFIFARVPLSSLISHLLGLKRGHQMSTKCQKKRIATILSILKFEIFFCYKSAIISHNRS